MYNRPFFSTKLGQASLASVAAMVAMIALSNQITMNSDDAVMAHPDSHGILLAEMA